MASERFEWVGGDACLDFTNTVSWNRSGLREERLAAYPDLVAWAAEAGLLGSPGRLRARALRQPRVAAAALARAHRLRALLHGVFLDVARGKRPTPSRLQTFNSALVNALGRLGVARRRGRLAWAWTDVALDLERPLRQVVWSAAGLLTSDDLAHVRTCANQDCGWLFLDRSRRRNRRWCDMSQCGSRDKARRYYRRKRGQR